MTQEKFADISSWQDADPRLDGLQGVMIKSTQGTDYTNPKYEEQRRWALANGKQEGSYHFADGADAIAEANYYVENTHRENGQAQALDAEGDFFTKVADPVGWCLTFLQEVEKLTGNKPGIYLNTAALASYDWSRVVNNNTWLWIADWNGQNQPHITQFPIWTLYQYADTNISGGDSDIFNGDSTIFAKIAANENAPVPAAPVENPAPAPNPTPAPIPVLPPSPAPASGTFLATVSAGDTFSSIAAQFNVSLAALENVNPGLNYDLIFPGQVIHVPGTSPIGPKQCVVSPGDTMGAIAAQFGVTLEALEAANPHIADFNLIYPGQVLNLP